MLCIAQEGSKSVGVLVGKVRENRFCWEPWWERAPVWRAGGTTGGYSTELEPGDTTSALVTMYSVQLCHLYTALVAQSVTKVAPLVDSRQSAGLVALSEH